MMTAHQGRTDGMFEALFLGWRGPTKDQRGRDEQRALAVASPPPLEDGSGGAKSSSSSSSSTVMLRSNPSSALGLKQLWKGAGAFASIVDTEVRTEASSDADDSSVVSVEEEDVAAAKGKEPLGKSLLDGKPLLALSPHRLMEAAKCIVLCCLYMAIGPTLILLNKHIMKDLDGGRGFNYPMFLSCLGLISCSITSHVLVRAFGWKLPNQDKMMDWGFYMKNVVPVGVCGALTLACGNAVYLYLTVSFIQMLKAFTPVVVLAIGIVFGIEKAETKIVMSVLGICAGTALASYGEINFSVLGISIMFAAEVTEAVRLVLVQHLLKSLKFSIVESQYYLAPCAAVALFSLSMLLEVSSMQRHKAWEQIVAHPFLFLAAGTLGVGVHFLSFLVVQATSSVTLKVLGTARNALLVLASVYLFGEVVTPTQFLGYLFSLTAFTGYSYIKARKL